MILPWEVTQAGHNLENQTISHIFYWKGLHKEVKSYVRNYAICQRNKYGNSTSPWLLQPIPIPNGFLEDISLDFIEGLPASHGKQVILVVIDKLSKYAHFYWSQTP